MGKLRALKLGISKGIAHTLIPTVAKHRLSSAVDKVTSKMVCTSCGHASNSHTRRHAEFQNKSGREILEILMPTRKGAGFDECFVFYCDYCTNEALACDGHFDNDSCGGLHKDLSKE